MLSTESQTYGHEDRPLGEAINTATRSLHAQLNKLIISRLPLALPPCASDPSNYVTGLLHVAPIYITFESLWQNLLRHHESSIGNQTCNAETEGCKPGNPLMNSDGLTSYILQNGGCRSHKPLVCDRIHSILSHLYFPGLIRSSVLRSDIRAITGWPETAMEEQLHSAAAGNHLGKFLAKTKVDAEKNPHILLAHAWVFYMALFAGGKFIKGSLEATGLEFWAQTCGPVRTSMVACNTETSLVDPQAHRGKIDTRKDSRENTFPLDFFRFNTALSGEDLKIEFKNRFAESEILLTRHERDHVIQEAIRIFENTIMLVSYLDELFGTVSPSREAPGGSTSPLASRVTARPRDSLVVARQRALRSNKLIVDEEKRSASSMNAHGTLTPMAETTVGLDSHKTQNKAVRFEKLAVSMRSGQQHRVDSYPSGLDGTASESGTSLTHPTGISYFKVSWHYAALAGLVVALVRIYFNKG